MRSICFAVALFICAGLACEVFGQTADNLRTSVLTHFTVSGGGAPYVLSPTVTGSNPSADFATAAHNVHADMVGLGYTLGSAAIDGTTATTPIRVIWRGCSATSSGGTPAGTYLDNAAINNVILLATGFDGTVGSTAGTMAYARATAAVTRCTVYAVGGRGYSSSNSNGGNGEAHELDANQLGLGAFAYGGRAYGTGAGGNAYANSNSLSAWAEGGDSDTGNGGDAIVIGTPPNTAASTAIGGDTSSPGDGGSATATSLGSASATGGSTTGTGNGGDATANPQSGFGNATGGSTTGSGDGGDAVVTPPQMAPADGFAQGGASGTGNGGNASVGTLINAMGGDTWAFGGDGDVGGTALAAGASSATAVGGNGSGGAGGDATADASLGGPAQATGGNGNAGGHAIAFSGGTGNADATGGTATGGGDGGNATANSVSIAGTGTATATSGSAVMGAGLGGFAWAVGPTGNSGFFISGTWASISVSR